MGNGMIRLKSCAYKLFGSESTTFERILLHTIRRLFPSLAIVFEPINFTQQIYS
jgi:hypothetical protein